MKWALFLVALLCVSAVYAVNLERGHGHKHPHKHKGSPADIPEEILALETALTSARKKAQTHKMKFDDALHQHQAAKAAITAHTKAKSFAQTNRDGANREFLGAGKRITHLQKKINTTEAQIKKTEDDIEEKEDQVDTMKSIREALQNVLRTLKDKNKGKSQKSLKRIIKPTVQHLKQIDASFAALDKAKKDLVTLKATLAKLQGDLTKATNERKQAQDRLTKAKADTEGALHALNTTNVTHKKFFTLAQSLKKEIGSNFQQLINARNALKAVLDKWHGKRLREYQMAKVNLRNVTIATKRDRAVVDAKEAIVNKLQGQVEQLVNALADARADKKDAEYKARGALGLLANATKAHDHAKVALSVIRGRLHQFAQDALQDNKTLSLKASQRRLSAAIRGGEKDTEPAEDDVEGEMDEAEGEVEEADEPEEKDEEMREAQEVEQEDQEADEPAEDEQQ